MTDAFLNASPTFHQARRTAVRDRSAPVVMPDVLAGHMPDPRETPAPAHGWRSELTRPSFLTFALAIVGLGAFACGYLGGML